MQQEIANNKKEMALPEFGNHNQVATPLPSDEQNLLQSSDFWKKTSMYIGISTAFAAASALLHSDKGISYAQYVWHFAINIKNGFKKNSSIFAKESSPLKQSSKETALGAATTFAAALATEYSWNYLNPHVYSNPKKDEISKAKDEDSSNLDKKMIANNNNKKLGAYVIGVVPVATAIGSALVKDKHGISYAQLFWEKITKDGSLDRSKIISSKDSTRIGAVGVWLTAITTGLASLAVHKIYNRTVDGKEKQL